MLQGSFSGFTLYQLIYYFIIYSIIGWCMETVLCSVREKKFVDRGFLSGPYCPIYGFGMCAILLCLTPLQHSLPALFLGGMVIASCLEYVTSFGMEKLFHSKWWDYSDRRFNLHGRICLSISLCWGVLSVVIIKLVHPLIAQLVDWIPPQTGNVVLIIFAGVFLLDFISALVTAANLSARLRKLDEIKSGLREMYEKTKWSENAETLKEYLDNHSIAQLLSEISGHIKENLKEQKDKQLERVAELKKNHSHIIKPKFFERRMIDAFPTMRSRENKRISIELGKKRPETKKTSEK